MAFYSVIHLPPGDLPAAAREMARVVRPGGQVLVAFHRGEEVRHLDTWWGHDVSIDFRFLDPDAVAGHLRDAGMEIVARVDRAPIPAPRARRSGRTWSPASRPRRGSYAAPPPTPTEGSMTYCLALRLDEGLVFLADTRTNAGVDNVSTYRKLHVLRPAPDRVFVLRVGRQPGHHPRGARPHRARPGRRPATTRAWPPSTTSSRPRSTSAGSARRSPQRTAPALAAVGADGTATFILGGQIGGERPDILLVYPEGNYIRASDDRPFLQIGESKYGKFMLELAVHGRRRPRAPRSRSRSAR